MKEEKRSFHKKRKWVCPECKTVRFQSINKKKKSDYCDSIDWL